MNYTESLAEVNLTLNDSDDTTFTPEQKARAVKKAWNDSYVVSDVTDNSLVFVTGTRSYAKPSGFTTVTGIGISASNNLAADFVSPVGTDLWTVQGSNIVFKNNANSVIPTGYVLYITGRKKLDWNTDTLDTTSLQEYVIALGSLNSLTLLSYTKVNLFLKNDTSLGEIIALKRELEQDVTRLRAKLASDFETA